MSRKLKKKTSKKKEIQFPMKFNPGLQMFQPELPVVNKKDKKIRKNINWWAYIYVLICILTIISLITWITLVILLK